MVVCKRDIFFDILCGIHILGKVGCKLIPEEWEIVIFVGVVDKFQPTVVVDLIFIIHNLVVVWNVHGIGKGAAASSVNLYSWDPCLIPLMAGGASAL